MRISFVSPSGSSGGVLYPIDLANELRHRGHDVEFLMVAFFGEEPSVTDPIIRNFKIGELNPMAFAGEIENYDVVICTNWQAASLISKIDDHLRGDVIDLIQGDERKWAPPEAVGKVLSLPIWKNKWRNVFVSNDLRSKMVATGVPSGSVIYDGISDIFLLDEHTGLEFDVGFVWHDMKNSNVLIPSILSCGRTPSVIGIGPPSPPPGWDDIKSHKEWIPGPVGRNVISRAMSRCRFWMCPSKEEGFGLVPIEAMSRGAIPITSRIGVMKDLENDIPVMFVDDPSSRESWKDAIERCMGMSDEEFAIKSSCCRDGVVKRFRISDAADSFEREISPMGPTLSVCMITKSGKDLLDECLQSIEGLWDELIIVIDDDPEDGIEDVCIKYGATVLHRPLDGDFASQRNYGFEHATGDFLLWLDSDDFVPPETVTEIERLVSLNDPNISGYYFDYHYSHDKSGNVMTCLRRERLLRRESGWRWKYEIHEICECDDTLSVMRFSNGFPIIHQRDRLPQKFVDPRRNLKIIDRIIHKYGDDPRMIFYAAKENLAAGNKTEALSYFKSVVDILSKQQNYDEHLFVSCMEIACIYNDSEDLKRAKEWAYKAIDADPRWAETYCLLGNIADKMGDALQAIDMFEAARNLPIPDDVVLPTNPCMYGSFPSEMISRLMAMDVVIPVHGGADYLSLCLSSLKKHSLPTTSVIVVSNPPEIERIREIVGEFPETILVENDKDLSFAENCNIGMMSSRKAKVCLLNSDTIVTPGWDEDLIRISNTKGNGMAIIASFSNGEYGWRHTDEIIVDGVRLINKHRIDDLGCSPERIEEVCGEWAKKNVGQVEEYDWVTFASCLIPKKVIRDVGFLDEKYRNSMEDVDYCIRLKKMGGKALYSRGSFVFHFCGASRYPDGSTSLVKDDVNSAIFQKKTSLSDMKITFCVGESWEEWTPDSINTTGIGGSETCVVNAARCLSEWGWNVEVFSTELDGPIKRDGVIYKNHRWFDPSVKTDVLIVSRKPYIFDLQLNARLKILYNHDASYGVGDSPVYPSPDRISQIDIMFMLSEWHRMAFHHQYPHIPLDKFVVTRNGIDIRRFIFGLQGVMEKDMKKCFYTSSADRGLESLLKMWPKIREVDPELELHIFYGMETWKKSIELSGDEAANDRMNSILKGCEQPGIIYRGRTGQMKLAREMMRSNLWLYPTAFLETSCISGMESLASLCMPITTPIGALPETLSIAGPEGQRIILADFVDGDCMTDEYQDAFVEAVARRIADNDMNRRLLARGHVMAHNDWRRITSEWTDLFMERM